VSLISAALDTRLLPGHACSISWQKGAAARRLLPECELLALLDLDVTMTNWSLPLTELLTSRWHFDNASVLMALDPDMEHNYVNAAPDNMSPAGRLLNGNTGFMVFRNRCTSATKICLLVYCRSCRGG
jgi:hypothetical protein